MSIIESLKKLVDPVAARQTEAELRSAREQPRRASKGGPPSYECRVCGYLGQESDFCPQCLAGTMRPSRKPLPEAEAAADTEAAVPGEVSGAAVPGEIPPVEIPPDGTLDLHTFAPAEVKDLLDAYVAACLERGLHDLRVVHGKGTGTLKRTVESALARDPRVESFRAADESAGGWGATLVKLRRP